MEKSNISELEFQLRKLITKYSDFVVYHQWPSEHERWVELIFALITRISNKPESEIRDTVEELDDIELLNINELSEVPKTSGGVNIDYLYARRIFDCLSASGFTEEESIDSILAMHEAAQSLKQHLDGKIQKYLRSYGQRMIDELSAYFSFSKMDHSDVKFAFAYWLQNVLNMPVNLQTKNMDTYCEKFKITINDLVRGADNLDINLALVDDLIDQYVQDSQEKGTKK